MNESPMVGWDFSRLDGRMWSAEPPWDFEGLCAAAMRGAGRVLDLGTGGGERLIRLLASLPEPRPQVTATEGWAPNIPVATRNLAPYGVDVLPHDPETDPSLPLPAASVDLVMNRHEAIDAAEVAHVLRRGGVFLTQQVDGTELPELREIFGGRPAYPDVTLDVVRREVADAGLTVTDAAEWAGDLVFADARALEEYLALVPWDRPEGFDAGRLPEGRITLTQKRFWLSATR